MKPTVYLRLADLRAAGPCQSTASALTAFTAGRVATGQFRIETEGQHVGMQDQQHHTAGGSGRRGTA